MSGALAPGFLPRVLLGAGLAVGLCLLSPVGALAHALVVRSDPAAGSSLTQVPAWATITFSEAPEPSQSSIVVVNGSGAVVSSGPTRTVSASPLQLRVRLSSLLNGVYTVRWKTVSADDGHASSGDFTFGVGATAYISSSGPAPELAAPPSAATPPVVAGHWIFYVGLGLLVGGAWVSLFALRGAARRLLLLTLAGAFTMVAGLVTYALAQAVGDHIPLAQLPGTSLGIGVIAQIIPGLLAAACAEVALWRGGRTRTGALALATFLAAVTILVHVLTTHAVASQAAWLMIASQWAHLASFATWIGGLAALLVAVGSRPSPARTAAVRRFSQVAAVSLGVVGVTGLIRAEDEVAAWNALVTTLFGQLVMVKIGLLAALATLGAVNHFRSVPAAARSLRPLRQVGRVEIGVAAVMLVASAMLTSLVPPAFVRATPRPVPPPLEVARGSAAGVQGTLAIGPGYPGQNRFTLRLRDARSSRTVLGDASLSFTLPARPELGATTLDLRPTVDGSYSATGPNLSWIGDWQVTASVRRTSGVVLVPFRVTCDPDPAQGRMMTMGNVPMVHGIQLPNGWQLQAYLTPGSPGKSTLHILLSDQRNAPATLSTTPFVTAAKDGQRRVLHMLRLTFGTAASSHFYTVGTFAPGRWTFRMSATTDQGAKIVSTFALVVPA